MRDLLHSSFKLKLLGQVIKDLLHNRHPTSKWSL